MSIDVNDLSVWLPGRGVVLGPLSFSVAGLTLLTGRSGAGGSTVLRALAGTLPRGALVRGARPADSGTWIQLVEEVRALDELREATAVTTRIPGQEALLLLDQPLAGLPRRDHQRAVEVIAQAGRGGVSVLWAEHELGTAVPVADQVLELPTTTGAARIEARDTRTWTPRTLPLPPVPALARALGMPQDSWWDPERVAQHPGVAGAVPRAPRGAPEPLTGDGSPVRTAPAARTRLPFDLVLEPGECLGITTTAADLGDAVEVAGRVVALTAGEKAPRRPVHWPHDVPLARLVQAWRRTTGTHPDAVAEAATRLGVRGEPHLTLRQHSRGEQQLLCAALLLASARPEVLVSPEQGLDPAGRRRLARVLSTGAASRGACTVLVSDDPELLARACHRVLVLEGTGSHSRSGSDSGPSSDAGAGHRAVLGPPVLTADQWPVPPALRGLGARALRVVDVTGDREEVAL